MKKASSTLQECRIDRPRNGLSTSAIPPGSKLEINDVCTVDWWMKKASSTLQECKIDRPRNGLSTRAITPTQSSKSTMFELTIGG
jgi:hypothetical protein